MRAAITLLAAAACGTSSPDDDASTTSSATITTTVSTTTASTSTASTSTASTSSDTTATDTTAADTTTSVDPTTLSLTRVADTFVVPTLPATDPKRFADVAHDPTADVYLEVNGNVATSGTFLAGDGAILGSPFVIAEVAYTQGCRVAFGSTSFLVAWHDNRDAPNAARVRARSVRYTDAPQLGADVQISPTDTYSEMRPAIAWSQASEIYLLAYHTITADDIHAQLVDADANPIGPAIPITADPDWQSDAGIAWNPTTDAFLVVYTYAGATTEVRGRIVAADGTITTGEITIATAKGTWLAQAFHDTATGDWLVAWFDGRMAARTLAQDGTPTADAFELATGFGSYDGFAVAHDSTTGFFAAVFHGNTDEDFAIAFDSAGNQTAPIEATSSRGADGNFNPRIASRGDGEWLVVTSRGFAEIVGQRLGP